MHPTVLRSAVEAAVSSAEVLGLRVEDAAVVHNSNRIAVRLVPCDVLARVATERDRLGADFEVAIARLLAGTDTPMALLEPRVAPGVYGQEGFAVTFWTYYEVVPPREVGPCEYARALGHMHACMKNIADPPAPHFMDRVAEAQQAVDNPDQSPELRTADRQLLHVDLETCCRGPVEFDVAHAPEEVGEQYPGLDQDLLRDCRILMLAMITAWRWDRRDQLPGGRSKGIEWLHQLRTLRT